MDVESLLTELEDSRERLLVALSGLSDAALQEPGVSGSWSIADILAHLVVWESELVTGLMHIDQGKTPRRMLAAYSDVEGYNTKRYEENRGRELDRIFDDLQRVRRQLESWVEELSESVLDDPGYYPWAKGKPLWRIIRECSSGHEDKHLPEIEGFAARWQSSLEENDDG